MKLSLILCFILIFINHCDAWFRGVTPNTFYLIGKGALDWVEARRYCEVRGGFLAEPKSIEEIKFLRETLSTHFNSSNFWLGLRRTEDCVCRGGDIQEPKIERDSLSKKTGALTTYCPSHIATKLCAGYGDPRLIWLWTDSGQKLKLAAWSYTTGEPHSRLGAKEHCVLLWNNAKFRWADWQCDRRAITESPIRALCEKQKTFPTTTISPTTPTPIITEPPDTSPATWPVRTRN